jgi:hypothetical protein
MALYDEVIKTSGKRKKMTRLKLAWRMDWAVQIKPHSKVKITMGDQRWTMDTKMEHTLATYCEFLVSMNGS